MMSYQTRSELSNILRVAVKDAPSKDAALILMWDAWQKFESKQSKTVEKEVADKHEKLDLFSI